MRDVQTDEGVPAEYQSLGDAVQALQCVNDLKKLNPNHSMDEITIYRLPIRGSK
jgi:hypothetical protein